MCATGESIETAKFKLQFVTCSESVNSQPGFLDRCQDENPLPAAGSRVRVTCVDGDSALLYSQNVVEGEIVVLNDSSGLPEEVVCSVFETDGTLLQSFVVNFSGDVNLFLKDKFGSLELLACDEQDWRMGHQQANFYLN